MRKILILFLCFTMLFTMSACNSEKKDGPVLFSQPDFTSPPIAEGDTVITSLDTMIEAVHNTQPFTFAFSKALDQATQTLYTDKELTKTEKMDEAVSPLGLLTDMQEAFNLDSIRPVDAANFTISEDGKMAYCKSEKLPQVFQGCIVHDLAFDLTTQTLVVRGIYVIQESNVSATYYTIAKLTYVDTDTYKLSLRCEEFGDNNGTEYVFITTETMEFDVKNNDTQNVKYSCTQDTAVYAEVMVQDDSNMMYLEEKTESERVIITVNATCENGVYYVERAMSMAQSKTSYDPNDATLIYNVSQTISQRDDGSYLLTETATAGNETQTQYVTFVDKKS